MKIAVLQSFYHPEANGVVSYIDGLYSTLQGRHHEVEVDVIALDTVKTKKYSEKIKNFNVHRIDCWTLLNGTYAVPSISGYRQLRILLRKGNYDLVNTHTRFFMLSFLGIWLGKKMGIKTLHTEHGSGFVQHGNKIVEFCAWIFDNTFGRYVLLSADFVSGVSKSVCQFAEKLGVKKTVEIYNGIDLGFWKIKTDVEETRREIKISQNDFVVLFVGRLVPSKGCQDLILALDGIKNLSWKLLVVGDGFYQKDLEQLVAELRLGERVLFLGRKNKEEIRALLQVSGLFVNPSFASEGMPTTVLEAAACECACISSDMGGAIEAIGPNNVYPAKDVEKLRERILNYEDVKKTNPEEFDWKIIAEKFYELLKSI